jgi:lipopolysaccharide transport system permease protein
VTAAERQTGGSRSGAAALVPASVSPPVGLPRVRVEAERRWRPLQLKELVEYRELLYFLTWRDLKVRYRQTLLGGIWAVLQPFMTMVVFSVFFGHLAKIPSEGVPYPLFAFAALLPWTFFATSIAQAANSLTLAPELITKVFFPRVIIPLAAVVGGILDFLIAFVVLLAMMAYYGSTPDIKAILILPLLLLVLATTLGASLWLSALNVEYRDIRYAIPFLVQFWLFATPIAYPSTLLGEPWRTLYGLNPMVGVVEGFRWSLLDSDVATGSTIVVSALAAITLLVSGLLYFRRVEDTFADVI